MTDASPRNGWKLKTSLLNRIRDLALGLAFFSAGRVWCGDLPHSSVSILAFQRNREQNRKPVIKSISPVSGSMGTVVVVRGKNFTPENNVIQFRGKREFRAASPVGLSNGTILQFPVTSCPSAQAQCPEAYIPPGVYHFSVINAGGQSNWVTFSLVRPR